MFRLGILLGTIYSLSTLAVISEPIRPLLTKENRFPGEHRLEVDVAGEWTEIDDEDEATLLTDVNIFEVRGTLRFGVLEDLAASVTVPYVDVDPDFGPGESGEGDIEVGLELKMFEDIFDFPYVITHAQARFDTGDDGLAGASNDVVTVGVAVGTIVHEIYHFIADLTYEIHEDDENIASLAIAWIWDVSEEFSIVAEGKASDDEVGPDKDNPAFFQGGLIYEPVEDFMLGAYVGGGKNSRADSRTTIRATYTF